MAEPLNQIQALVGEAGADTGANGPGARKPIGQTLGILTLLFGATAVFAQLQSSLNQIWDGVDAQEFIRWYGGAQRSDGRRVAARAAAMAEAFSNPGASRGSVRRRSRKERLGMRMKLLMVMSIPAVMVVWPVWAQTPPSAPGSMLGTPAPAAHSAEPRTAAVEGTVKSVDPMARTVNVSWACSGSSASA